MGIYPILAKDYSPPHLILNPMIDETVDELDSLYFIYLDLSYSAAQPA